MAQSSNLWDHADQRPAPTLYSSRMADERFVELLTPDDIWRAHGMGVLLLELMSPEDAAECIGGLEQATVPRGTEVGNSTRDS